MAIDVLGAVPFSLLRCVVRAPADPPVLLHRLALLLASRSAAPVQARECAAALLVAGAITDLPRLCHGPRSIRRGALVRVPPLTPPLVAGSGRPVAAGALGLAVVSRLTWRWLGA